MSTAPSAASAATARATACRLVDDGSLTAATRSCLPQSLAASAVVSQVEGDGAMHTRRTPVESPATDNAPAIFWAAAASPPCSILTTRFSAASASPALSVASDSIASRRHSVTRRA